MELFNKHIILVARRIPRTLEGVVGKPVGVRVPPSAPSKLCRRSAKCRAPFLFRMGPKGGLERARGAERLARKRATLRSPSAPRPADRPEARSPEAHRSSPPTGRERASDVPPPDVWRSLGFPPRRPSSRGRSMSRSRVSRSPRRPGRWPEGRGPGGRVHPSAPSQCSKDSRLDAGIPCESGYGLKLFEDKSNVTNVNCTSHETSIDYTPSPAVRFSVVTASPLTFVSRR